MAASNERTLSSVVPVIVAVDGAFDSNVGRRDYHDLQPSKTSQIVHAVTSQRSLIGPCVRSTNVHPVMDLNNKDAEPIRRCRPDSLQSPSGSSRRPKQSQNVAGISRAHDGCATSLATCATTKVGAGPSML
ncbi:hypothetical protein Tco_1139954 [Tanacetum coccineum]